MIKRRIIIALNLVIDTFEAPFYGTLLVTYKGNNMLCDSNFQQNTASVTAGHSLILYKKSQIDSIKLELEDKIEDIDYKIIESYI